MNHKNQYPNPYHFKNPITGMLKSEELVKRNIYPAIEFIGKSVLESRRFDISNRYCNGVDIKIIQEYLGHSTITTTANFYLHPDKK